MKSVIRRFKMAERKVARLRHRAESREKRQDRHQRDEVQWKAVRSLNYALSAARKARREDWEMGPIAPKRDVIPEYGAMHPDFYVRDIKLLPHELDERAKWCGGRNTLCLAKGDRVAILEGRWKGQIGVVGEINRDRMEAYVAEITKVNVLNPEELVQYHNDFAFSSIPMQIPISWLRLVYPLPHPGTGLVRDTIIHQLVASGVVYDRPTHSSSFSRVVPRLNISIPWPVGPDKKSPEEEQAYRVDTVRMEVEKPTFVPTLFNPPIPPAVLDELRGRYSRFRTRHEPKWERTRMRRDVNRDIRKKQDLMLMRTPAHEFNVVQKLERKAAGVPKLDKNMLIRIGQVIARNRPNRLAEAERAIAERRATEAEARAVGGDGGV